MESNTELLELQKYCDEQFKTITNLKETIERLESDNKSLLVMISGNTPSLEFNPPQLGISNEQLICETQITLLKEKAISRELNSDEVRRFSQLFEVLEKIKKSSVNIEDITVNKMSNEDLIRLVVDNGTGK